MSESLKEVKTRIDSTKKTSQITKAMHMVSSSKVRRSQKTFNSYQDFVKKISDLVVTVLNNRPENYANPLFNKREVKTTAYLLISSDTGLAGPYNSNIFKFFEQSIADEKGDYVVATIGRKAYTYAKNKNHPLVNKNSILIRDDVMYIDIVPLAQQLVTGYLNGSIDKLVIIYNHFVNSLTQETKAEVLLPLEHLKGDVVAREYLFEGGVEKTLDEIIPMYINTVIYGIILDAKTAEHSSRMNSMKNATDNAEEIIDKLQILYNRARQSAITTELIDIIAGANAVE
jgi:F-type H+-transporting ATPase subunit gamma